MITNLNAISFAAALCLMWVGSSASRAEETPDNSGTAERQAILKEMRAAVAEIKVTEKAGDQIRSAKLIEEPIFRYSDEQRQIRDATMWVWTERGRPVSLLKLERYGLPDAQRQWLLTFVRLRRTRWR